MRRSSPPFRTIVLVLTIAAVLFVAFPVSAQGKPILVYYAGPEMSSVRQALTLTDEITLITDPKQAEATEKYHLILLAILVLSVAGIFLFVGRYSLAHPEALNSPENNFGG